MDNRYPNLIYSDDGNEFKGECKKYIESKGIQTFISRTKVKAAIVERFNRTLKEKMYRYFDHQKVVKTNLHAKRWRDVLDEFIESYKNSFHRSISMKPTEVNKSNQDDVYYNLYGFKYKDGYDDVVKIRFKPGNYVRLVKSKLGFRVNLFLKKVIRRVGRKIFLSSTKCLHKFQ